MAGCTGAARRRFCDKGCWREHGVCTILTVQPSLLSQNNKGKLCVFTSIIIHQPLWSRGVRVGWKKWIDGDRVRDDVGVSAFFTLLSSTLLLSFFYFFFVQV